MMQIDPLRYMDTKHIGTIKTFSLSVNHHLPVDDFFALCPYEVLFVRGQDAQRVLLTRPGLAVDDVGALIHVDCTLR